MLNQSYLADNIAKMTQIQWRRAIEAFEARAPPPDSIATVVNTP